MPGPSGTDDANNPAMPPTLATQRLTLRVFEDNDIDQLCALVGDKRVYETTLNIPHPYTEDDARSWLARQFDVWDDGGAAFGMFDRASGDLIGGITLMTARPHDRAELGYWIAVPYWGHGYASEAAHAVVDFGFRELGLERIWAGHFGHNEASGRVQRKIGMRFEGVLKRQFKKDGVFVDDVVHAVIREEWETGRPTVRSTVPTLDTPRLILRPPTLLDLEDMCENCRHKEVADGVLTIPHPFTEEDGRTRLRECIFDNENGKACVWFITLAESDAVIGDCGFRPEDDHARAVMGYTIRPQHWNSGYATEAIGAMLQYAFASRVPAVHRMAADHYVDNHASGRVCEKLGMAREGVLRGFLKKNGEFRDVVRWAIIRDDWLKTH